MERWCWAVQVSHIQFCLLSSSVSLRWRHRLVTEELHLHAAAICCYLFTVAAPLLLLILWRLRTSRSCQSTVIDVWCRGNVHSTYRNFESSKECPDDLQCYRSIHPSMCLFVCSFVRSFKGCLQLLEIYWNLKTLLEILEISLNLMVLLESSSSQAPLNVIDSVHYIAGRSNAYVSWIFLEIPPGVSWKFGQLNL